MIIPWLPLLLLFVRYIRFRNLGPDDLPKLTEQELTKMHRSSATALGIVALFVPISLLPLLLSFSQDLASELALGLTLAGLLVAAPFDLRAERLKRRGMRPPPPLVPLSRQRALWSAVGWFVAYFLLVFIATAVVVIVFIPIPSIENDTTKVVVQTAMFAFPAIVALVLAVKAYNQIRTSG